MAGVTLTDSWLLAMVPVSTQQDKLLFFAADSLLAEHSTRTASIKPANQHCINTLVTNSPQVFTNKLCGRPPQYAPASHVTLTFDQPSKAVSESPVTWSTCMPILVFLDLSILDLGPMYATDVRQKYTLDAHHRLMPPWREHNKTNDSGIAQ